MSVKRPLVLCVLCASVASLPLVARREVAAQAPQRAMFGNTFVRNMVSAETGLPGAWDVKAGRNVKWWADVGSQAYAGPVVLGGKVFVGTNNDGLRNPKLTKDRGVVMAFDAAKPDDDVGCEQGVDLEELGIVEHMLDDGPNVVRLVRRIRDQ